MANTFIYHSFNYQFIIIPVILGLLRILYIYTILNIC
jgi:hypothetical protein